MSLTVTFAKVFGEMFVPHDTAYYQAKDLIRKADINGDGVLDLNDQQQRDALDDIHRKGFLLADSLGRQNGVVSLRELRKGMLRYDTTGDPTTGGPNHAIEGAEWIHILADASQFPG